MKNILKSSLVIFFSGTSLFAASQPPDIGHFKGLAFSSATDRHPLEIIGGSLLNCETDSDSHLGMAKCQVDNGTVVVTGTQWNALNIKLVRVSTFHTTGDSPSRIYYGRGTVDLTIGGRTVSTVAGLTLTIEDSAPERLRGFIDLPAQAARSSIEAYLVR